MTDSTHEFAQNTGGTFTPTTEMHWTRHRIIAALQTWTREHGAPPTATDWDTKAEDGSRPTTEIVKRRFGSWNAAKTAAGLPTFERKQSQRSEWLAQTVRIEVGVHARLEELAARQDKSMAALLRAAINDYLEAHQ